MMKPHTFHIPVMGIGYTIDTALKVARYGMDSALSLVDDILLEKLRKMYCEKYKLPYNEITDKDEDFRAARITAYLNLLNQLVNRDFEALKASVYIDENELQGHFDMLPEGSSLKQEFDKYCKAGHNSPDEIKDWIDRHLSPGSIDVNIMTKIDKDNYLDGKKLPVEYNDAHAALRGFAQSDLRSSIVLSAGINPRLYSYMAVFEDFYPDKNGDIKKKIVLKVSDVKSALIQGKFLAKKGLWVSEYRIESGLNCGGHAFATEGHLLGPILAEFRDKREELISEIHEVLTGALTAKGRIVPDAVLPVIVTAQGGVGTAEEHKFLIDHYHVDSVGWGTPFLLVPEATTIDDATLDKLVDAREDDLYLSDISPLGVPFNSLKGNTKDLEKLARIADGKPGSSCSKKYAALSNEFSDRTICTASRRYQMLKLRELDKEDISAKEHQEKYDKIVEKSCICVGLGTTSLIANHMDTKIEGEGVSVCPGPNLAYFTKLMSLKEMTDHIYGRANVISRTDRPNMFIKELNIYIEFLKKKIEGTKEPFTEKQSRYFENFASNLQNGIEYYYKLFSNKKTESISYFGEILQQLNTAEKALSALNPAKKEAEIPIDFLPVKLSKDYYPSKMASLFLL